VVSELAERPWSDASGLFFGQKTGFSGDFQGPNLTVWDIFGRRVFNTH
jgi:hypothetical protein